MIIKSELINRIKDYFDLNIYETKVWMALLSKGVVSAGETAEISNVPRSRTYDVLESLAKRGFCMVKVGKPLQYVAVDPKVVIEKMKLTVMSDAHEKVKRLSTLRETPEYNELDQIHKAGIVPIKVEDLSGHIKGRQNILTRIKEIFENAEKEITISTTITDFENKLRVILPVIEELVKKNLKLKISLLGEDERIKRLNTKYNLKIKKTDSHARFYIGDKKEILFMINPETNDHEDIAIWLNSPYFTGVFVEMLDTMKNCWN